MQKQRDIRGPGLEPCCENARILGPVYEGHLLEVSSAFTDSTVVVSKGLNLSRCQVASPPNPRKVRVMPFGRERSNHEHASHGVCHFMQHGVEVRAGYPEVSGAFGQS